MTVSILDAITRLPSGGRGQPFTPAEFGAYLRTGAKLNEQPEKDRNARHARRDRLYQDGGDEDMARMIREYFESDRVRDLCCKRIEASKFSNSLKRIVDELSTVYAEPARRYVDNEADQRTLDALLGALDFDEQMGVVNAMLNLHRAVLVGPRVRVNADDSREMVIDIATPSTARAVANPLDTTQILAWLIAVDLPLARNPWAPSKPAWVMWSDHEWCYLDENLTPIEASWTAHGLGVNRWVPLSYSARSTPGFWPGKEGEDLVAARMTMWLTSILMVKETENNTKQPLVQGDTSQMARGQVADSRVPIAVPEGVTVTTIDVGTDPAVFITAGNHALESIGNNYGLSMGVLTHQGTQSAEARDLLLAPIRERRKKQIKIMRRFEARLIRVMARVAAVDLPAFAFDPTGFRIDFAETQTLLAKADRLALFETERRLGLTNTVEYLMNENPDIDEATAWADIAENVEVETNRRVMMNDLIAAAGSMGAAVPIVELDAATKQPPNAGRAEPADASAMEPS